MASRLYHQDRTLQQLGLSELPPLPFSPEIEAISYSGEGDELISVHGAGIPRLLTVSGTYAGGHLRIWAVDGQGNDIAQLINTTEEDYSGRVSIDLAEGTSTEQLRIESNTRWALQISSLSNIHTSGARSILHSGKNSWVFLRESTPEALNGRIVQGPDGFIVRSYTMDGRVTELLNTSDASAAVFLSSAYNTGEMVILEVQANGYWELQID